MLDVTIRPPRPGEGALCRMLLPETPRGVRLTALPRNYLLATVPQAPYIAGAVSWHRSAQAIFGLQVHVVPPLRRQGVGSRLLRAALESGPGLAAHTVVESHGESLLAAFLERHGFRVAGQLLTCEAPFKVAVPLLAALARRARTTLPLRFVGLAEAPLDRVAKLCFEHVSHAPQYAPDLFRSQLVQERYPYAQVAFHGAEIAGVLLAHSTPPSCHVDALVVAPRFRGSSVQALLMQAATEVCLASGGVSAIRFDRAGDNLKMAKLQKRLQAEIVASADTYVRAVSGEPASLRPIRPD